MRGGDFVNAWLVFISIYKRVCSSCLLLSCLSCLNASIWGFFILSSLFPLFYFLSVDEWMTNSSTPPLFENVFISFPVNFTRLNLSFKPASHVLSAFENVTYLFSFILVERPVIRHIKGSWKQDGFNLLVFKSFLWFSTILPGYTFSQFSVLLCLRYISVLW